MKKKCGEEEIYDNTYQKGILSELLTYTVSPGCCPAAKLTEPMNPILSYSLYYRVLCNDLIYFREIHRGRDIY